MKGTTSADADKVLFLSDLCGREAKIQASQNAGEFLSDLCGREVAVFTPKLTAQFLSDLCGREVLSQRTLFIC